MVNHNLYQIKKQFFIKLQNEDLITLWNFLNFHPDLLQTIYIGIKVSGEKSGENQWMFRRDERTISFKFYHH